MNQCPCGYMGHPRERCRCTPSQIARYHHKLSGPLLDRLDVHVRVPPVSVHALTRAEPGEASSVVRERVLAARERQLRRHELRQTKERTNSNLSLHELDAVAPLTRLGRRLLEGAAHDLGLSARAWVKVLRVARTSADLAGKDELDDFHVEEALQGRLFDRRAARKLPTDQAPAA
jgi:magnesium chelatase family protein